MKLSRFSFLFSIASSILLTVSYTYDRAAAVCTELIAIAFPATPNHLVVDDMPATPRVLGLPQSRSFRSLFLARLPTGYAGAPALA